AKGVIFGEGAGEGGGLEEGDGGGAGGCSRTGEGAGVGAGVGGRGMGELRRPRRWPSFRKMHRQRRLVLSQGKHATERHEELAVDVENDHDGEGISRWAAMTQFLDFVSYQMDGLRSNHLRFTSPPLREDLEVTGYPVVTLWVSAADDLPNLDVFVYLQAVRARTRLSIYVTEGCFRAEHRKEANRIEPRDARALPGVPIHSFRQEDAQKIRKDVPVELSFKLMPTSFKFLKGQRIRLSIGGADARHFSPIDVHEVPSRHTAGAGGRVEGGVTHRVLRVHTGGRHASRISLPSP
ncbi:unnamed protein product, partial [Discosporangium mesarthrocarpum]